MRNKIDPNLPRIVKRPNAAKALVRLETDILALINRAPTKRKDGRENKLHVEDANSARRMLFNTLNGLYEL